MICKNIIPLSLVAATILSANEIQLPKISVESTTVTEVSKNAQVSADLAQALSSSVPSIDMNRRSGIANDIYIRGQKRDNISVDVDGTKVCGACVNRMDPPISHIVTNQIEEVEVIEGPYDVENFGTLSGGVKITTKEPTKELQGEVNFGLGSWGYKKIGASVSGGTDRVRALLSFSHESSDQYEDGDGNTIAQQIDQAILDGAALSSNAYQTKYHDIEAYTKKSVMTKIYIKTLEDQELRLSYTGNRSDDVLYGNSKMDAAYDDSNIYSIEYNIDNLTNIYKNLNIQYYYSDVDHPMDTKFRIIPTAGPMTNKYNTNHLKTSMQGVKLKNSFELDSYKFLLGLDGSRRTWEGESYSTSFITGVEGPHSVSLTHTQTENKAIFAKAEKSFSDLTIETGMRFDMTEIEPDSASKKSNNYNAFSANIVATYALTKEDKIFVGIGSASRVPDARELYLVMPQAGNENLKQTKNREIDLGYEALYDNFTFKAKTFYSMLEDYIYYTKTGNTFNNIDATVYGAELSASIYATDALIISMGASYKVGEKDNVAAGIDKDLADIAPLRGNIALNYEYMNNSVATLEMQASDNWDKIDSDNGEQKLSGWSIYNAKIKHEIDKHAEISVGINNIFDKTYAASNTYADLILLTAGGASDVMLMNEPGRYFYTNLTFKF
ncbi:MAG TPA: TonB-dependent receptor [Sulfurimonas sp.]